MFLYLLSIPSFMIRYYTMRHVDTHLANIYGWSYRKYTINL